MGASTNKSTSAGSGKTRPHANGHKKPKPPTDPALIAPEATSDFGVIYNAPSAVTISDLVNFSPAAAVDHMEPNGWAVIGLSTNFYSTIGPELKHGTLLGQPAAVRFIPIGWRWSYGDGTTTTLHSAGATWKSQGIADFNPTSTSHVYRRAGAFTIQLSIQFGAEYQFAGSPWLPVNGTITVPTNPLAISVGSAKTVLVNRDCTENPRGPGC